MAFNFDQFNNSSLLQKSSNTRSIKDHQIVPSGYVKIRKNDEKEIFQKSKMNLTLPASITHLCVSNNYLMVLLSNQLLFRLNLKQPDKQSEVFMEKFIVGQRVSKVFLDPTGTHLFLALTPKSSGYNSELMYLNRNSNKPKLIPKLRDHEVTAIGFNCENSSESTTGNILIGTSKGLIFETDIGGDSDKLIQNNWKQVFDLGRGEAGPVTGIGFYRANGSNNFIVLICTLDRLYKFHEVIHTIENKVQSLQPIFTHYLNVPEEARDYEQMSSTLNYSQLDFVRGNKFPKAFGWLTEEGVYYGELNQIADSPNFITSKKTLMYPEQQNDYKTSSFLSQQHSLAPYSFVLTDFHILLQYSDRVTGISLINHEVVYDECFNDQYGKLMSIVKDLSNGNIYTFSNKTIFRYRITNEHRDVWQMYLDINELELAKIYSRDNPAHYDIVLSRMGDDLYKKKQYLCSSKIYAQTKKSFEDIALKFLKINENLPLIEYLKSRIIECESSPDQTQITMLVIWIIELYLTEMSRSLKTALECQKDFDNFMHQSNIQECLKSNRKVIYNIIASHGDSYNLSAFTAFTEDYEDVIDQYIVDHEYQDALATLKIQRKADLVYKFAPVIMEELPVETVQFLIERGKSLNSVKLLPSLLHLRSEKHRMEIIKYLEFSIHSLGVQDQSIHNYLVQLYAKYRESEKLMSYFETQGKELSMIHYDIHYSLRLCKEFEIKEACVFLLCLLDLWNQAVELALTLNSKLAQQIASQPVDRELKRKLWLIIAERHIMGKENVEEALELLKICDLLRIEDLLPFFSDFQKIDHFKEAICKSLNEYNQKIQEQMKEMEECAEAAEKVRNSVQSFRNRSVTISAQDKCSSCGTLLLLRPFYLFPCSHKFHNDCLEKNLIQLLNPEEGEKLSKLQKKLSTLSSHIFQSSCQNNTIAPQTFAARDQLKQNIEKILAAECTLCGSLMIQQLNKQFIDLNNAW